TPQRLMTACGAFFHLPAANRAVIFDEFEYASSKFGYQASRSPPLTNRGQVMAAFQFEQHNDIDYSERDRPLSFHWQMPEVVSLLGLPPARNACQAARQAILAEAILGWQSGQRVSYSRSHDFYSMGIRYRGTDFTYATVM